MQDQTKRTAQHLVSSARAGNDTKLDLDGDGVVTSRDLRLAILAESKSVPATPVRSIAVLGSSIVRAGDRIRVRCSSPGGVTWILDLGSATRKLEARSVADDIVEVVVPDVVPKGDRRAVARLWASHGGVGSSAGALRIRRGPVIHQTSWNAGLRMLAIHGSGFGATSSHVEVRAGRYRQRAERRSDGVLEVHDFEMPPGTTWMTVIVDGEESDPVPISALRRGSYRRELDSG